MQAQHICLVICIDIFIGTSWIRTHCIHKMQMTKYGTHAGITCDGCGVEPVFGFRWHCQTCANHDLCDSCYDIFRKEHKLKHQNQRRNPISLKPQDHKFSVLVERGVFKCMKGASGGASVKLEKKQKPNAKCQCGSGKKYKKCCGAVKKCTVVK